MNRAVPGARPVPVWLAVWLAAAALALGADQNVDRRSSLSAPEAEARMAARTAEKLQRIERGLGPGISVGLDASGRLRSLARSRPPLSAADSRDPEAVAREFVSAHRDSFDL